LEIYYKYAEEIIKKDKAYVCSCKPEVLRENRAKGKDCSCRKQSVEQNLKLWKEMFKVKEGSMTLRIKTSMQDKDPAFRDRVIFRISEREHPRIKKKYRIWPLLDFSWAVDDYLLGMTHVLRGKDLMIETKMEEYIFDIFKWKKPEFIHTGLLQIEGIKLSKSKGQKEIKEGKYSGWDDPRTWSLQSLERRGIQPEAIRKFIISQGLTKSETTIPIDILYSINKDLIKNKSIVADFKEETKTKANIKILMPDASEIFGKADIKIKKGDIAYFKNSGYSKYQGEENKKQIFWFCHK